MSQPGERSGGEAAMLGALRECPRGGHEAARGPGLDRRVALTMDGSAEQATGWSLGKALIVGGSHVPSLMGNPVQSHVETVLVIQAVPANGAHLAVCTDQELDVAHVLGEAHVLESEHVLHQPVLLQEVALRTTAAGQRRLLPHGREEELQGENRDQGPAYSPRPPLPSALVLRKAGRVGARGTGASPGPQGPPSSAPTCPGWMHKLSCQLLRVWVCSALRPCRPRAP